MLVSPHPGQQGHADQSDRQSNVNGHAPRETSGRQRRGAAVFVHYGYRPGGSGGSGSRGTRAGSHGSGGRGFGGSGSLTGPGSFRSGGSPIGTPLSFNGSVRPVAL